MTISQKLQTLLESRGMFDTQAKAVLEIVKNEPANESMAGRWNDSAEDYPDALIGVLWVSTKRTAREWLAENMPMAWFRPMFEESAP